MQYILPKDTKNVINKRPDNFNLQFNKYRKYGYDSDIKKKRFDDIKNNPCLNYNKDLQNSIEKTLYQSDKTGKKIEVLEAKVDGRMIIGLGSAHVNETAMTLHHIYGIPYIPGSGIKGALRNMFIQETFETTKCKDDKQIAICEKILESFDLKKDIKLKEDEFKKRFKIKKQVKKIEPMPAVFSFFSKNISVVKQFQLIFGTQSNQGKVIFLDAYPVEKIKIKNDIMTPHYSEYYSEGKPPADYYNPTPIKFATVENTTFRFAYLLKSGDINKRELENKFKKLLTEYGLGAKTAIGHGYFENVENETDKIIEDQKYLSLSLIEREQQKLLQRIKNIQDKSGLDSFFAVWQTKDEHKQNKEIAKKLKTKYEALGEDKKKNGELTIRYKKICKISGIDIESKLAKELEEKELKRNKQIVNELQNRVNKISKPKDFTQILDDLEKRRHLFSEEDLNNFVKKFKSKLRKQAKKKRYKKLKNKKEQLLEELNEIIS